jgi:hypothetical protein
MILGQRKKLKPVRKIYQGTLPIFQRGRVSQNSIKFIWEQKIVLRFAGVRVLPFLTFTKELGLV